MPETLNAPAAPAPSVAPTSPAAAPAPAASAAVAPTPLTPAASTPGAPASTPASTTPTPSFLEQAMEKVKPGMTWEQFEMPAPAPVKPIIDATGRAHAPESGQFVTPPAGEAAPVPTQAPAPDAPPAPPAPPEAAPPAAPAADAPPAPAAAASEPIVVPLTDRNGREVEVTTSDPELAETLRMYKNDGMRRQQYDEAMKTVRAEQDAQQRFVATWESTPETVFDALKPDLQKRLAEYVIATRFDTDFETIKRFAEDPTSRRERLVDIREQVTRSSQDRDQRAAAMQHATRVSDAVRAMVPQGTTETQASPFLSAAAAMITGLVQQGRPVTPETVPEILAPLRSAYGLTAPVPAQPSPSVPAATSTDDLAAHRAKAQATVERLARVAEQRAGAQAIAPAGAGPSPVTAPMPPKGASIDDVTAHLKQRFRPGMTWTDFLQH